MSDFAQNFIQAYEAGNRIKTARERLEGETEDRKIRMEQLAFERKRLSLQDKIQAQTLRREGALGYLKLAGESPQPQEQMPPDQAGPPAPAEGAYNPVEVPGFDIPEMGLTTPTSKVRPEYREDIVGRMAMQEESEARTKMGLNLEQKAGETKITQEAENVMPPDALATKLGLPTGQAVDPKILAAAGDVRGQDISRQNAQTAAASRRSDPNSMENIQAVRDAAQKVVTGEMTITEARGLLGGVKGGLGPMLLKEISATGNRIVPPSVRKDLTAIETVENVVNQMEEIVEEIKAAPTMEEKIKKSALLEGFGRSTGTLLARGFGEKGVVTDQDVERATSLAVGWKSANFAPEFADEKIRLLKSLIESNKGSVSSGYFQTLGDGKPKAGGTNGVPTEGGSGMNTPSGTQQGRPNDDDGGDDFIIVNGKVVENPKKVRK